VDKVFGILGGEAKGTWAFPRCILWSLGQVPWWSLLLLTSVKKKKMTLSMAPGSQEASFLTVEEEAVPTTFSSTLNRAGTPDEGSSIEKVDQG
jgi:hypothetical protein